MEYSFRNCTLDDFDFLFELKKQNFKWYVDKIWGWHDEEQKQRLKQDLEEHLAHKRIILVDNKEVGVYVVHITENGDFVVNLLQCRPLHIAKDKENISMPEQLEPDSIFLQCKGASMGLSCATKLDFVVMVDPVPYYEMEYKDKYLVAKALGEINWAFREKGKHMILLVPGRICTSSPELGVPTAFADISEFDAILEVSETRAGYMPELSYGSHIFQDLVEAEILYGAVFDNEKTLVFSPDFFEALPNDLKTYAPKSAELEEIVKIWDVREQNIVMYHDMKEEMLLIQSE